MYKTYTSYGTISYCCYCGKKMVNNYDEITNRLVSTLCYCLNAQKELELKEKIEKNDDKCKEIKNEIFSKVFDSLDISDEIMEYKNLEKENHFLYEELNTLERPYGDLIIILIEN